MSKAREEWPVDDGAEPVIIRSWPKGVFLYPCLIASLLAAALSSRESLSALAGQVFMVVFAVNILVIAWDFSRTSFTVTVLLGVIAILTGVVIQQRHDLLGQLARFASVLDVKAHPHFYLCMSAVFSAVLALSFLQSRLDYWEVHGNELLHVTGFVKNVERFAAPSLTFRKTLPDVFEYCLLGSGTVTLEPVAGDRHVLQHVLRVNAVSRRLEALLSTIEVTVEQEKKAPAQPQGI